MAIFGLAMAALSIASTFITPGAIGTPTLGTAFAEYDPSDLVR